MPLPILILLDVFDGTLCFRENKLKIHHFLGIGGVGYIEICVVLSQAPIDLLIRIHYQLLTRIVVGVWHLDPIGPNHEIGCATDLTWTEVVGHYTNLLLEGSFLRRKLYW